MEGWHGKLAPRELGGNTPATYPQGCSSRNSPPGAPIPGTTCAKTLPGFGCWFLGELWREAAGSLTHPFVLAWRFSGVHLCGLAVRSQAGERRGIGGPGTLITTSSAEPSHLPRGNTSLFFLKRCLNCCSYFPANQHLELEQRACTQTEGGREKECGFHPPIQSAQAGTDPDCA